MRLYIATGIMSSFLLLTTCGKQGEGNSSRDEYTPIASQTDIDALLNQTEKRVCLADFRPLLAGNETANEDARKLLGELMTDTPATIAEADFGVGYAYKTRRTALGFALQAYMASTDDLSLYEAVLDETATQYFRLTALSETAQRDLGKNATALARHITATDYWTDEYMTLFNTAVQMRAPEYLTQCIIFEQGGASRSRARSEFVKLAKDYDALVDFVAAGPAAEDLFWRGLEGPPPSPAFNTMIMRELSNASRDGVINPARYALMRDGNSPYLESDPTQPDVLLSVLTGEFEAISNHFKAQTFQTVAAELRAMTLLDQYGRILVGSALDLHLRDEESAKTVRAALWELISRTDASNTQRLKELLSTRVWFDDGIDGEGASFNAWLIAQHADKDPEFQRDVLARMQKVLDQGIVRKADYALLFDRVALKEERPQRYGSQGKCTEAGWEPFGLEDAERVDDLRAEMGLEPMTDYKSRFRCS